MSKFYELLVMGHKYATGSIILIVLAFVGYRNIYSTSLGYIDYIPPEKEEYMDVIYSLEAEEIHFNEAVYKFFGTIPDDENKIGVNERIAILGTLLTLHEEFYEKTTSPGNNFYMYGWPYFMALEVKNTKSKSAGVAELSFLREQAIRKLETEVDKIISIYKNSSPQFHQYAVPFLLVISELNEELESNVYWQYIEELEKIIKKVRRQRENEIKQLKEELRQLKEEEELTQKTEYLKIIKERKIREEELIDKIEKNIEKAKNS